MIIDKAAREGDDGRKSQVVNVAEAPTGQYAVPKVTRTTLVFGRNTRRRRKTWNPIRLAGARRSPRMEYGIAPPLRPSRLPEADVSAYEDVPDGIGDEHEVEREPRGNKGE